jgi:hypothetical protein
MQADSTDGCISQDGKDGNTAGVCTAAEVGGLDQVQKVDAISTPRPARATRVLVRPQYRERCAHPAQVRELGRHGV